jgi:hypothetical protein
MAAVRARPRAGKGGKRCRFAAGKRFLEGNHRMPLDRYREQIDGRSMTRASAAAPAQDEPETEMAVKSGQEHWLDPDSYWDTTGERPLPEFDWGDD